MGWGMRDAVDYNLVLQKAYYVSIHYIHEIDMAKDIAQATAIKYYLNEEKIEKKKSNSWIYTVSKNLSFNYLKKHKKEFTYVDSYFEQEQYSKKDDTKEILDIDDIVIFSIKEKNLLKQYYAVSADLSLLARKTGIKKKILRNKIYVLEQEIKLFELLNDGILRTKSIPGTKLHRNIQNFLRRLKTCLDNNDLLKMKYYFSNCTINDEVSSINIKEIAQYDIDILEKNKYMLNIGYFDLEDEVKFFRIRFEISEGSTINVIEFPIMPKKVFSFDAKEIPIEILRQMQSNKKGVIPLTQKEFDKLIESQKNKIEVLVDRE